LTVRRLIKAAPDCDETLTDWGETPEKALFTATELILDANQGEPQQVFQQIWYDFYRDHPQDYLREMVKLGYDGVLVDRVERKDGTRIRHAVVFNPDCIQPVEPKDPDHGHEPTHLRQIASQRSHS
jgi:hypothetical protein